MTQIRIARLSGCPPNPVERYATPWIVASAMNRWLLKVRLVEALACHGAHSYQLETSDAEIGHSPPSDSDKHAIAYGHDWTPFRPP